MQKDSLSLESKASSSTNMEFRLGGPDLASLRFLAEWPYSFVVFPQQINSSLKRRSMMFTRLFGNGSLLFDEDSALIDDVREIANGDLDNLTPHEITQYINYFTSRVRNYANAEILSAAGIRHAIVRGTCHEGHFVAVANAISWLKWMRGLTAGQYVEQAFGRDLDFPPYGLECDCRMEGLIPGTDDFHRLNGERKHWKWFHRNRGKH